jgi:hypothetical protein
LISFTKSILSGTLMSKNPTSFKFFFTSFIYLIIT